MLNTLSDVYLTADGAPTEPESDLSLHIIIKTAFLCKLQSLIVLFGGLMVLSHFVEAFSFEQVDHVLVALPDLILYFLHRAEGLINVIQLIADLCDPQVHLLFVEVFVKLNDLIEMAQTGLKLALHLIDQAKSVMTGFLGLFRFFSDHLFAFGLVPAQPSIEVQLLFFVLLLIGLLSVVSYL